ncbi:MAG TPA: plastocyanin/azurin family copper-binding protein [Gemmatimonadales bacterium]|nr:plastocyanin/azurin family copper-binding protein [Gemmatimonadales bacterium]
MNRFMIVAVPALVLGLATESQPQQLRQQVAGASQQGRVHRVRMLQQGSRYTFEPAGLRIQPGDIVEFVNVSGFPHNVQFYPNRIPAGAADVLNRNMTQRMGPVAGPMMTQPNQTYRVSFAGAPQGTYDYFCLPHQAMGMIATIIVGQPGGPGSTINTGEPTPAQVRP